MHRCFLEEVLFALIYEYLVDPIKTLSFLDLHTGYVHFERKALLRFLTCSIAYYSAMQVIYVGRCHVDEVAFQFFVAVFDSLCRSNRPTLNQGNSKSWCSCLL